MANFVKLSILCALFLAAHVHADPIEDSCSKNLTLDFISLHPGANEKQLALLLRIAESNAVKSAIAEPEGIFHKLYETLANYQRQSSPLLITLKDENYSIKMDLETRSDDTFEVQIYDLKIKGVEYGEHPKKANQIFIKTVGSIIRGLADNQAKNSNHFRAIEVVGNYVINEGLGETLAELGFSPKPRSRIPLSRGGKTYKYLGAAIAEKIGTAEMVNYFGGNYIAKAWSFVPTGISALKKWRALVPRGPDASDWTLRLELPE